MRVTEIRLNTSTRIYSSLTVITSRQWIAICSLIGYSCQIFYILRLLVIMHGVKKSWELYKKSWTANLEVDSSFRTTKGTAALRMDRVLYRYPYDLHNDCKAPCKYTSRSAVMNLRECNCSFRVEPGRNASLRPKYLRGTSDTNSTYVARKTAIPWVLNAS